jgi:hypothetical protein
LLSFHFILLCAGCQARDIYKYSTVEISCEAGDTNFFKAHLKDINTSVRSRRPGHFTYAIIVAAEQGNYEMVQFLLNLGANANVADWRGNTTLHAAMNVSKSPPRHVIELLVRSGIDINATNSLRATALLDACTFQPTSVVETLLRLGANTEIPDINQNRPVQAVSSPAKLAFLFQYGADINATNRDGETAIDLMKQVSPKIVREAEAVIKAFEESGEHSERRHQK